MIGIGISPSLLGHDLGGYPLDSYSGFQVIYSVRHLLTSYTGDLVRLRRNSDQAESDFGFDGNGDLDTAAITTWLDGANGFIVTWYDQSGNGFDAAQATAALQPQYIASGINSKPVFRNNPSGSLDKLVVPDEVFRSLSAGTLNVVCEANAGTSGAVVGLWDNTNSEFGLFFYATLDGKIRFYFGSIDLNRSSDLFTFTDPHIFVGKGTNGALCHIYVDGAEVNYDSGKQVNATTTPASFTLDGAIGQANSVMTALDGNIDTAEMIVLASALSDADRNAIEADQSAYFNI